MPPTPRLPAALAPAALGLWIGAVAAVAFLGAPLVFGAVPEHIATKDAAARVIGPAFARVDLFGVGAALLGLIRLGLRGGGRRLAWRRVLLAAMLLAAALDALWLAPAITARRDPLATYHALATSLWMFILAGGLALMLAGLTPRPAAPAP